MQFGISVEYRGETGYVYVNEEELGPYIIKVLTEVPGAKITILRNS